jgi:predicted RNA-binding protein with PIN domain
VEYWIDGYNLILRRGGGRLKGTLEDERRNLVRSLGSLGAAVRVYFDAARFPGGQVPKAECPPQVSPIFVTAGAADDAITDDLRKAGAKVARLCTVVTDDRELRLRSKQLGATSVGVDKFLEHLAHASTPVSAPKLRPPGRGKLGEPMSSEPDGDDRRPSEDLPQGADFWLKEMDLDPNWTPDEP